MGLSGWKWAGRNYSEIVHIHFLVTRHCFSDDNAFEFRLKFVREMRQRVKYSAESATIIYCQIRVAR